MVQQFTPINGSHNRISIRILPFFNVTQGYHTNKLGAVMRI